MYKRRWLLMCWEEKFNDLDTMIFDKTCIIEGVLLIAPPFCDITLSDGFWGILNIKLGTLFDFAEEEYIDYTRLPEVVSEMISTSGDIYNGTGDYEVRIGEQFNSVSKNLKEKISYKELRDAIDLICSFLEEAFEKNKSVIIML